LISRGSIRIRPIAHVGRKISVPINPRKSVAFGQLAANASRTLLVVSLKSFPWCFARGAAELKKLLPTQFQLSSR
jgi:hypothetical protein